MPYPLSPDDSFQRQLSDLQKQLGQMTQPHAALPAPNTYAFDYVDGIEGARAFLGKMLAGDKHVVWDSEKATFYVLQKDANGNPARIQIGDFTLKPEPSMEDKYVTREDFNALVSRLDQLFPKKEVTNG